MRNYNWKGGVMLTDVEIAQSAKMKPISEIAQKLGLEDDDLELYGKYKAKIALEAINSPFLSRFCAHPVRIATKKTKQNTFKIFLVLLSNTI